MKKYIILISAVASMSITSCRKEYTCVCDTVQADGTSAQISYNLVKQTYDDANDFCERYEDDLNGTKDGTTGCHL